MKQVNNNEYIQTLIKKNKMAIVYFTGNKCGACEAIKLKVEEMIKKYPKIEAVEIQGEDNIQLAYEYDVYSLPVCLLYVDGKESLRIGKNIDLLEFEKSIDRYYDMLLK